MRRLALLQAVLLLAAAMAHAEPRRRVLSLNLCTDQLLLALADPEDIAGVTRLARDCRISAECAAAARVPVVRGTAEEVIALHPRLVLGGSEAAVPALAAARRLGIEVLTLPRATSLEFIRDQIAQAAAALGQPERGRALLAEFDRLLAAVPQAAQPQGRRPVAAVYEPNGFTAPEGSLADAVLGRAGLDNYTVRERLRPAPAIPLEYLVLHPPDLLVTGPQGEASLAEAMLWHPALRHRFAGHRVTVPAREWICGGPATPLAVARLARARLEAVP